MLNTEEQPDNQQVTSTAHIPSAGTTLPDAASTRVSTEEFTAAIQALEQRKAEEARRFANTVEVGKTIQDLNIDATPEDVMREVIAQRNARNAPRLAGVPPHSQMTDAQAATREQLRTAAVMLKNYYDQNISPGRVQVGVPEPGMSWRNRGQTRQGKQWGAAIGSIAAMVFVLTNLGHHGLNITNIFSDKPAVHTHLAQLAEGQTDYIDTAGLKAIFDAGGVINAANSSVMLSSEKNDNTWELFRSGSNLYLKAYVTEDQTRTSLQSGPVRLYSQDNGGELHGNEYQTVVVPLSNAKVDGTQTEASYSELTLESIHLDANSSLTN